LRAGSGNKNIRDPGGKAICYLNLLRFKNIYLSFSWIPGCAMRPQDDKRRGIFVNELVELHRSDEGYFR